MKEQLFINKKNEYLKNLEELKKQSLIFSTVRLFVFLGIVGSCFLGAFINPILYIVPILLVIAFFVLAFFHDKLLKKVKTTEYKIGIMDSYLFRRNDNWKDFQDKGNEFLDKNQYYQTDLDLFGPASLYQYITTAKTPYGRKYLADSLKNQEFDNLEERQKAISELASNNELMEEIETSGRFYKGTANRNQTINSLEKIGSIIADEVKINKITIILAIILPIALIVSLILFLAAIIDGKILLGIISLNIVFMFLFRNNTNQALMTIFEASQTVDSYIPFLELSEYECESDLLKDYINKIKLYRSALDSFHKRANIINSRRNIIITVLGNAIFQFDVWCVYIFRQWQRKYQNNIMEFIKVLGHLEELNSLAVIGRIKDDACLPVVSKEIEFTSIKHPLLQEEISIGNDFKLNGLDIITGSNMSGKTTFMRTIGVNMILFNAGGFVTAKAFKGFYLKMFTSMRATDDVSQGISTFYAEILRIKDMLGYIKNEKNTLVLVDEIFKGTNTIDRICGAKGAIKRMSKPYVYGIIATHDNELCVEVKENYHFEEKYNGDQISFDYKIKNGIARTTNAKHLMRLAGIIGDEENE